jgi:hypothetical protein
MEKPPAKIRSTLSAASDQPTALARRANRAASSATAGELQSSAARPTRPVPPALASRRPVKSAVVTGSGRS